MFFFTIKQMTRTRNRARGIKYQEWVNQHTRLLNFFNNDVGYASDIATIAGLFLGVTDVFAVAKLAEDAEKGAMAVKEVREADTSLQLIGKGAKDGKSVEELSVQKTVELKKIGISRADLSTNVTLVSDITGVTSGVAQGVQSSTSGIHQGAIFGVTAGFLNTVFSGVEIGSIYKTKAAEKAEEEVEQLGMKSLDKEEDKIAEKEAAKLRANRVKENAQKFAKVSDSLNLALGTVLSIGAGIYYVASGSKGSGVVTTVYGISFAAGSFKNQISVGIKNSWKSVFKDAVKEV
jgi:hypothetical protein